MKSRYLTLSIICLVFLLIQLAGGSFIANADELSDSISEQLNNIDLSELESFFNNIDNLPNGVDFFSYVLSMLNGQYNLSFDSVISYLFNAFFNNVFRSLPTFMSIIAISIFCSIMQSVRSSFLSDSTADMILFVSLISIILLLTGELVSLYENTQITIKNIANLTEIMSPIILTLMVASGGTVSASVYQPTVVFLSSGVVNIFLIAVLPMIGTIIVFNVISNFSDSVKLNKYTELFSGVIKWIIGIIITVFSIFITVQGISSATFDGISIKATKFAISNSVPIIGGFLKDGFDLVVAGSILIKNVIGITCVFALFYVIISPVLYIASFSLLLKLVCAVIEPIVDARIVSFCSSTSKCITYLAVSLLAVGFMLFLTILLITFSASVFI